MLETVIKILKIPIGNIVGVLILLSVFLPASVLAQKSHLGLMAGFAGATMNGSYIEGSNGLEMGFHFFVTLDREFNDRWSIESGFSWIQKGGKELSLSGTSQGGATHGFQTSYLQVPVLLRLKFPIAGGPWYVVPFAGAAIGTYAGGSYKEGNRFEFAEDATLDENSPGGKPKSLELSVPFGSYFWINFPGDSRFILGVKFELGLTNVFTAAEDAGQKARNNTLVLMFGFVGPLQ
jgi:hypothetical protein